jgi:WhiB family redox-sensing transcriptional regulator
MGRLQPVIDAQGAVEWLMTPDAPDPAVLTLEGLIQRPEWQRRAACRGAGIRMFFPERGEPTAPARSVCAHCPVSDECRAFAVEDPDIVGVWGNTSGRERQRSRGRSRGPDRLVRDPFYS